VELKKKKGVEASPYTDTSDLQKAPEGLMKNRDRMRAYNSFGTAVSRRPLWDVASAAIPVSISATAAQSQGSTLQQTGYARIGERSLIEETTLQRVRCGPRRRASAKMAQQCDRDSIARTVALPVRAPTFKSKGSADSSD
jgi:hypothetical protein